MKKIFLYPLLIPVFIYYAAKAQPPHQFIYSMNNKVDIPIMTVGTAWSLYCFTKIYFKDHFKEEDILALKKEDVWAINRWAIQPYDRSMDKASWVPFLAAIPLPAVYFSTSPAYRNDYHRIFFVYWESMAITGLLGTAATFFVDKPRPYTYDERTPMEKRLFGGGKNSFYAGHVALVAVSTFVCAKVHEDYNPGAKDNWMYYATASAVTGFTAYGRYKSGMHFPTDILLGLVIGTGAGLLVPQLHK